MCGKFESALAFSVVMVRTVVTPRVIRAGVALLVMITNNEDDDDDDDDY